MLNLENTNTMLTCLSPKRTANQCLQLFNAADLVPACHGPTLTYFHYWYQTGMLLCAELNYSILKNLMPLKLACLISTLQGCDSGLAPGESPPRFPHHAQAGILPPIILAGMSGAMATSSIDQQQRLSSLFLLDPWLHGGTKGLTSQAHSSVPQRICKATADPACVEVCAHHIIKQKLSGRFWVILTPLAKDATEIHMRKADRLSLLLGPISNSYIAKLRSVHMWGQVLPVIICIKIEEYMWQAWN